MLIVMIWMSAGVQPRKAGDCRLRSSDLFRQFLCDTVEIAPVTTTGTCFQGENQVAATVGTSLPETWFSEPPQTSA